MPSRPYSGPNQDLDKIKPTGTVWVTSNHKHVVDQPYVGEGGFLASELLGALESLLFFLHEILSCVDFQPQRWPLKMPKPEMST